MNNQFSTITKWFWAWQDEKEEAWLSEMSQNGMHLAEVPFPGRYRFQHGPAQDYVYQLDYQSLSIKSNQDKESYLQLFEDAGWEQVGEMGGWMYFRILSRDDEAPEIFSDLESKQGKYQRVLTYLAVFLPIMLILFPSSIDRYGVFSVILQGIFILLIILYASAMIQLFRRINQLKHRSK